MERPLLPPVNATDGVRRQRAEFHGDVVAEVRATIERDAVVFVGMAQNLVVKQARRGLEKAGIAFTYLEYGSAPK